MTPQTYTFGDLPVIGVLVLLEGLLSADNALVLALMVRHLPQKLQRRALLYGLGGAFVFRLVAILLATWIIRLWWLQAIGAAYLLYLLAKHFLAHTKEAEGGEAVKARKTGFWQTVLLVELTDIAFAIDSVVAAVGMVQRADKLWLIYLGAIIGIVLLRFAATAFINLLEKFPALEHMAYVLVGWVGVKLAFLSGHNFVIAYNKDNKVPLPFTIPEMSKQLFWIVMAAIIVGYTLYGIYDRKRTDAKSAPEPPASE
ncbi:MAG: TerC family protein [Fimbriimonadaceae bacterium]